MAKPLRLMIKHLLNTGCSVFSFPLDKNIQIRGCHIQEWVSTLCPSVWLHPTGSKVCVINDIASNHNAVERALNRESENLVSISVLPPRYSGPCFVISKIRERITEVSLL